MIDPYRLPRSAIPKHYRLRITPSFEESSFSGVAEIDVEISSPLTEITLNAIDLAVDSASISTAGDCDVAYIPEYQRITLTPATEIPAGSATITASFRGPLNNRLTGFYRAAFVDGDGNPREIAVTQFEATDARRAFPCFDEPDFKATFQVSLTFPDNLEGFSNTREVSRTRDASGLVTANFAETMKMSTYLVAFTVGPFVASETVEVNGVPIRVIVPHGRSDLSEFSLDSAEIILDYLATYYGIPYPGDKLDHVAVPDFAFGAMENLGCIVYRESSLLVDPSSATQAEKQKVFDVMAHEVAHMWFGDLVTMKWWDGIWLNEAFATFMEMKATEALHPEWKRWLSFGSVERPWAYGIDGLPSSRPIQFEVISPAEANEMFDALTYGKGSSVLRMIEQFMGEDVFQAGVRTYLRRHAYSNTVADDLWKSLDEASRVPVSSVMQTWIHQSGYPKVVATVEGNRVHLSQERFMALAGESADAKWMIPIQIRGRSNGEDFQHNVLLKDSHCTVELTDPPEWLIANSGGHGYYRVRYSPDSYRSLKSALPHLDDLERFTLIDDAFAFTKTGEMTLREYLDLAEAFTNETEPAVWDSILESADAIALHVADDSGLPAFREWITDLARPSLDRLGWDTSDSDSDLTRRLRGLLIQLSGRIGGDPDTVSLSRNLTEKWLRNPDAIDPEVGSAAAFTAAAHGNIETHQELIRAFEQSTNPQMRNRLMQALALIDTEDATDATLAAISTGVIRAQDIAWLTGLLFRLRTNGPYAWRRVTEKWDSVYPAMPPLTIRKFFEALPGLSRIAVGVEGFFSEIGFPITRSLSQYIELLQANAAFGRLQGDSFRERFSK